MREQRSVVTFSSAFGSLYYPRTHPLETPLSFCDSQTEHNIVEARLNIHQLTSLIEAQEALEAHDRKVLVTNSSIVLLTVGILIVNVTCCIVSV